MNIYIWLVHPHYDESALYPLPFVHLTSVLIVVNIAMASLVSLTPAQSYSDEDWNKKRAIITKLYRDEARSLGNVQKVLAQHYSFRPR